MVFASLTFLCVFLPVVLLASFLLPGIRAKNALLVIASLVFYAYGEPVYVLLMLASVLLNWGFGLALGQAGAAADDAAGGKAALRRRKAVLALAVTVNLGMLAVFKYAGLLLSSLGLLLGDGAPSIDIALPIGISFFTFQALSYVIDVYRGENAAQRSLLRVLLFISFFPQLIAGPIIKYHDIEGQLASRAVTLDGVAKGLRRFVVGLGKKVLIANALGALADAVYAAPPAEVNVAVAWLGALAYLAQIYFDFSGYSDMAIGLARCFGFNFKENFDHPYASRSVKEFWRRWHISLSTWFRDYLYKPLGGNRLGRRRCVINKIIVFGLCGLWHGASWTFVAWGLFHGLFLLIEEYLPVRRLPRACGTVYTLLVVCVGFVLFRSADFAQAAFMLQQMFAGWHFEPMAVARATWLANPLTLFVFAVAAVAATPVAAWLRRRVDASGHGLRTALRCASYLGAAGLFMLCFLALSGGGYNPFIYFRF
jgi:alginate O-acetyltransferase complex protein AlgI